MTTKIVPPMTKYYTHKEILELNQPHNKSFEGERSIYFTNEYLTYKQFFYMNGLFDEKYKGCKFIIEGSEGNNEWGVEVIVNNDYRIIKKDGRWDIDLTDETIERPFQNSNGTIGTHRDTIGKLTIFFPNGDKQEYSKMEKNGNERDWNNIPGTGGRKASVKKEICGRLRCIYKIQGSRKEHIKYKGRLITVADYKKLMKKA